MVYTRFSISLVGLLGVLDLAFTSPLGMSYFSEWSNLLPSTSSDHIPILLRFDRPSFRAPPPYPNWALIDMPQVNNVRKSLTVPPSSALATSHSSVVWFDINLNRISATLALHTPLKPVTYRSKPW